MTLSGLPALINQAQGALNRTNGDLVSDERARTNAQGQVDFLQGQKTLYTNDIAKLNADIVKYQAEKTKLQQQGKSTTAITAQITTAQKKITTQEANIQMTNLQILNAEKILKQAKAKLLLTQATKTKYVNELAALNAQKVSVTDKKTKIDSDLAAADASLKNLTSQIAILSGTIGNSEKDVVKKKDLLAKAQAALKKAQEKSDAEETRLKPLREALEEQLAQLNAKKKELEDAKQDMQVATHKLENAREKKTELEKQAAEIQKNITMAKSIVVPISIDPDTKNASTKILRNISELEKQIAEREASMNSLPLEITQIENELNTTNNKYFTLSDGDPEKEILKERIDTLETKLGASRTALRYLPSEHENATNMLVQLKKELEKIQQK